MAEFLLALCAGHGRNTPGKRIPAALDRNQTREWVLNDRVCRYVEERAKQYEGFRVMRVDDPTGSTDVALAVRCARANEAGADFYLSNHFNANKGEPWDGGGIVAFCSNGSKVSPAWRDAIYDACIAAGGIEGNRSAPKTTANYYVLRNTTMPAVLMELGFMDSRVDAPIILKDSYAKAIGYAEADCIAKRAGLKLKSNAPVKKEGTSVEMLSLQPGDKNAQVKTMQAILRGLDYTDNNNKAIAADGSFGPKTEQALRKYQAANKDANGNQLKVDGKCGPATWGSMLAQ